MGGWRLGEGEDRVSKAFEFRIGTVSNRGEIPTVTREGRAETAKGAATELRADHVEAAR